MRNKKPLLSTMKNYTCGLLLASSLILIFEKKQLIAQNQITDFAIAGLKNAVDDWSLFSNVENRHYWPSATGSDWVFINGKPYRINTPVLEDYKGIYAVPDMGFYYISSQAFQYTNGVRDTLKPVNLGSNREWKVYIIGASDVDKFTGSPYDFENYARIYIQGKGHSVDVLKFTGGDQPDTYWPYTIVKTWPDLRPSVQVDSTGSRFSRYDGNERGTVGIPIYWLERNALYYIFCFIDSDDSGSQNDITRAFFLDERNNFKDDHIKANATELQGQPVLFTSSIDDYIYWHPSPNGVIYDANKSIEDLSRVTQSRNFENQFSNFWESKIYFDPTFASSYLTISVKEATDLDVKVISLVGQNVYQRSHQLSPGSNQIPVDLSKFKAGVYIVILSSNGEVATHKLIKQE